MTTLAVGLVVVSKLAGCSPSAGNDVRRGPSATAGTPGASGFGGDVASQGGLAAYGGDSPLFGSGGSNGGGPTATGGGCPELTQKPEQIITYRDATVTDTITTYSPVAIYLMQDVSSSMVGTLGDPNSWPNSLAAVTAFVQDPASTGLDVGLAVFPAGAAACDGTDCGKPVVEIGPLPRNAPALVSGMQASVPPACCNFTPTECALRGMINHCKDWTAKSGEQCVAVLVTDGAPSTCDLNTTNLTQIVADGKAAGVLTFTIGLPGSNKAFLDQLAQAGGSNASVDVSSGSAAFIAALNSIRDKVSTTSSHQIRVPTTVSTPLPCEWKIPEPTDGTKFQKDKVNVKFTPQGGTAQTLGYVAVADCDKTSNAWYYDDAENPTKVLVCPNTCDMLKASEGAQVDLAFGCDRIIAIPK